LNRAHGEGGEKRGIKARRKVRAGEEPEGRKLKKEENEGHCS